MIIDDIKTVIGDTLQLGERAKSFDAATELFGGIAEFDSMAVVELVAALEARFGIVLADHEITTATFATIGSLSHFIEAKLRD